MLCSLSNPHWYPALLGSRHSPTGRNEVPMLCYVQIKAILILRLPSDSGLLPSWRRLNVRMEGRRRIWPKAFMPSPCPQTLPSGSRAESGRWLGKGHPGHRASFHGEWTSKCQGAWSSLFR